MLSQMLQFIKYNTLSYDLRFVCPQIRLQRPDECTTKGSKEDERQNGRSNLSKASRLYSFNQASFGTSPKRRENQGVSL